MFLSTGPSIDAFLKGAAGAIWMAGTVKPAIMIDAVGRAKAGIGLDIQVHH